MHPVPPRLSDISNHLQPNEVPPDPLNQPSDCAYYNLLSIEDWEKANPHLPPNLVAAPFKEPTGVQVSKFHSACNARGLSAVFTFNNLPPFDCAIQAGGQRYDSPGLYATKKLAKERACEQILFQWSLNAGGVAGQPNGASLADNEIDTQVLREENWVGVLHEYGQSKHLPRPVYTEFRTTTVTPHFAFQVEIVDGGLQRPFRAPGVFPLKQTAKQAAARDAVLWLRSNGRLRQPPPKKPASAIPGPPPAEESHDDPTALTTTITAVEDVRENSNVHANDDDGNAAAHESLAHHGHLLTTSLGFSPPAMLVVARTGAFVTVAARFSEQDRQHERRLEGDEQGCLAYVHGVKGLKAAKGLCWQLVLAVLEEIARSRLPY